MRFDAPLLARGWLSVYLATSTVKDENPVLARTIAIEEFTTGVRLVATDRFVLLTAWVPEVKSNAREPGIEELPERTVIAHDDRHARGKGLLAYLLALYKQIDPDGDGPEGEIECSIDFDARQPAGTAPAQATFEGMEPTFVVLNSPDLERVYLPVVEGQYPDWRRMVDTFTAEETKHVALNPEFMARLAKLRAWSAGALHWMFGGSERVARVDMPESYPHVTGLVMPSRWTLAGEDAPGDPEDVPLDDDEADG